MMERLTMWTQKGASLKLDNPHSNEEARENLMAKYLLAVNKLAKYEDAEEQGLLLRLPCKVGDRIYITHFMQDRKGWVTEYIAVGIHISSKVLKYSRGEPKKYIVARHYLSGFSQHIPIDNIGKTVFLTREEAEKALEGEEG